MQKRITLDYDSKNFFWKLYRIYRHRHSFKKIEIIESTSKGYHIILWLQFLISDKNHFYLREYFKDDKTRIRLDKIRNRKHQPMQILFDSKKRFYYKKKRED